MRFSLFAARSAAFHSSRCVKTTPRSFRSIPSHSSTLRSNRCRLSVRQYATPTDFRTPSQESQPPPAEEKHWRNRKKSWLDTVRSLETEIENDPDKVLNEVEQKTRDEYRQQRFTNLMRTVPNPVAIVTTRRQDVEDPEEPFVGATVSSFKTVCIKPEPYVSFNLAQGSRTYKIIKEHKYFCITIPQNDNAGATLAKGFAHSGKSITETLQSQKDGAQILPHHWNIALEGRKTSGMKYPPPAVKASNVPNTKTDGLAFAFLCEYHDSISVGDHIVITGKLLPASIASASPWGRDDELGDSFSTSYVSLAYAHGVFGNPEAIGGLDQTWKLDDPFLNRSVNDMKPDERKEVLSFYEKRLQALRDIPQSAGSQKAESDLPTKTHHRAQLLSPEMSAKYLQYYQDRSVELHGVMESQHAIEDVHNAQSETARKAFLGWEALDHEEKVYLARLEALEWVDPRSEVSQSNQRASSEDQNSPNTVSELSNTVNWSSMVSDSKGTNIPDLQRQKLIDHFGERLLLIRQAKDHKNKTPLQQENPRIISGDPTIPYDREEKLNSFIESSRSLSLPILVPQYRNTQNEITKIRLARLQCLYQRDQYNEDVLKRLEERLVFFEQRLNALTEVLFEKYQRVESLSYRKELVSLLIKWEITDPVNSTGVDDFDIPKPFRPAGPGEKRLRLPWKARILKRRKGKPYFEKSENGDFVRK